MRMSIQLKFTVNVLYLKYDAQFSTCCPECKNFLSEPFQEPPLRPQRRRKTILFQVLLSNVKYKLQLT